MGAMPIERTTMVWKVRLVYAMVDLDHHWKLTQASSDGSLILSREFVRSIDASTLPFAPIHKILEDSNAEWVSQCARRVEDDACLRAVKGGRSDGT